MESYSNWSSIVTSHVHTILQFKREVTDIQTLRSLTIPSDSHVSIHNTFENEKRNQILQNTNKNFFSSNKQTVENGLQDLLSSEEFDERDVPCRTCKNTGKIDLIKIIPLIRM